MGRKEVFSVKDMGIRLGMGGWMYNEEVMGWKACR